MIRLLGRKTSGNVQKVLFFLEETGTDYVREDYGKLFDNTKTPEYLAMNPTAKVPTLVDGDVVLWESNAILRYLAKTRAPQLLGDDPAANAEIGRWMDFLLAAVNPGYLAGFKASKLAVEDRPAALDAQLADLHAQMMIVSATLDGNAYLACDKFTIADIALAPIMGRCLNFPYDRPSMPGLEVWFETISARPAFVAATG